jgi:hypothetical protein
MVEMRNNFSGKNLKVRDQSEDIGVDRKVILEWILEELFGKLWTGFSWLMIETTDEVL